MRTDSPFLALHHHPVCVAEPSRLLSSVLQQSNSTLHECIRLTLNNVRLLEPFADILRYVAELVKLNDTFIAALLPAQASSPSLSHPLEPSFGRAMSHTSLASPASPIESVSSLPIAARFSRQSETPQGASDLGLGIQEEDETGNREKPLPAPPSQGVTPRMRAYHQLTHGRPNAPSPTNSASKRSHHSLPPLPRPHQGVQPTSFSASHASRSSHHADASRKASGSSHGMHAEEHHLPADLEKVLHVLGNGILKGHMALSAALRRRYEAQYPLVRSLADVFIAHVSARGEF